jgi:acyl-CoA thioesterase-1
VKLLQCAFVILSAACFSVLPGRAEQTGIPATIVVLGDSLSAGYGLQPGESFPERLQVALDERGVAVKIVGAGVSGDTTSGGLARLGWSVPDGTDGVILELGANDGLRGVPVENVRDNLAAMIEQLQGRNIAVLLTGMRASPSMGSTYASEFDVIYPELAQEYETDFYPFFLDGVAADAALNLDDGIHPTAEGIDVIVERILPSVEALVEGLRPSP